MPRIIPIPWKVLECILLACGLHFSRQSGSHRVYTKEGLNRPLILPAHSKDLHPAIIKSNLSTLGITREEYFKLLKECE